MFSKIDVNGPETHPAYAFLRLNSRLANKNKTEAGVIQWNFAKFLVNEQGQVVKFYTPREYPSEFEDVIQSML